MIGVTIGTGEFAKLAHKAADTFRNTTGLDCRVLDDAVYDVSGLAYPHHLKYQMFELIEDHDTLVYFDADLWWMRTWDPEKLVEDKHLVVVRDLIKAGHIVYDCRQFDLDESRYFNSGFMILHRDPHHYMLSLARGLYDRYISNPLVPGKSAFKDQTSLNLSVQMLDLPVKYVDRRYNFVQAAGQWMRQGYPVIGAHKPQRKLPTDKITDLQRWENFFKQGAVPPLKFHTTDAAFQEKAGIYEMQYANQGYQRVEFLEDGTVGGAGLHEYNWWPMSDGSIHVTGVNSHPKKRCQERVTFIALPVEGKYNEWRGKTQFLPTKAVHLRKLA